MGPYGIVWDPMGHCGTLWDVMGCYGTLWDLMGHYGTLWDLMGFRVFIGSDGPGGVGLRGVEGRNGLRCRGGW